MHPAQVPTFLKVAFRSQCTSFSYEDEAKAPDNLECTCKKKAKYREQKARIIFGGQASVNMQEMALTVKFMG